MPAVPVAACPGSPPAPASRAAAAPAAWPSARQSASPKVPRQAPPIGLVVAEGSGRRLGFAVDSVDEVGELAEPTEETDSPLLAGAILSNGDLVGVIDVDLAVDQIEGGR